MFSVFGYYMQALLTGEGPVENWAAHIAHPFNVNGLNAAYMTQFSPAPVAMFAAASSWKPDKISAWYGIAAWLAFFVLKKKQKNKFLFQKSTQETCFFEVLLGTFVFFF